jgi:hypothetical protein
MVIVGVLSGIIGLLAAILLRVREGHDRLGIQIVEGLGDDLKFGWVQE